MPTKFRRIFREYHDRPATFLDVGCGNHSPTITKQYFPRCTYHGIDRAAYNVDASDESAADRIFVLDLDTDSLDAVPDAQYDVVILNHVVEHLRHPERVVAECCAKLRDGGSIYLEFPALRSLGLPSMAGTLQFCDDDTHAYLPDPYVIANTMLRSGVRVRAGGTRRDLPRVLATPAYVVRNVVRRLTGKPAQSRGLWDAKGFAFFLYGRKESHAAR